MTNKQLAEIGSDVMSITDELTSGKPLKEWERFHLVDKWVHSWFIYDRTPEAFDAFCATTGDYMAAEACRLVYSCIYALEG